MNFWRRSTHVSSALLMSSVWRWSKRNATAHSRLDHVSHSHVCARETLINRLSRAQLVRA